jgi:phage terminase small subunit
MQNDAADMKLRLEAAKCLMPFIHSRAELGKKDLAQTAAKKAGFGRFSASKPPLRVVTQ